MKPYDKPLKRLVITTLSILAGNALLAFSIAAFVIPHDIIMGGTTGVGIVLSRAFPQLDVSIFIMILNAILLVFGWIVLGKKFAATTVASSFLYPAFLGLFRQIPGIEAVTGNSLTATIAGGILIGISLGLVMRVGSSTGGTDVIVLVLNKWTHISVGVLVWTADALIIGGQALFSPAENTLLGILMLMIESLVLDSVMVLGKAQMQLFVISHRYEEIREKLLTELEAGVTMALIETGRLREQEKGLICVIPQRKLYHATELIHAIDPLAFITITKVSEVHGRGFTVAREQK